MMAPLSIEIRKQNIDTMNHSCPRSVLKKN
jgi:hypothetical protein